MLSFQKKIDNMQKINNFWSKFLNIAIIVSAVLFGITIFYFFSNYSELPNAIRTVFGWVGANVLSLGVMFVGIAGKFRRLKDDYEIGIEELRQAMNKQQVDNANLIGKMSFIKGIDLSHLDPTAQRAFKELINDILSHGDDNEVKVNDAILKQFQK